MGAGYNIRKVTGVKLRTRARISQYVLRGPEEREGAVTEKRTTLWGEGRGDASFQFSFARWIEVPSLALRPLTRGLDRKLYEGQGNLGNRGEIGELATGLKRGERLAKGPGAERVSTGGKGNQGENEQKGFGRMRTRLWLRERDNGLGG